MKQILVVLVAVMLSSIIHAQNKATTRLGSTAIEVGNGKLRLGMTKAEVTEQLAGSEFRKLDDRTWIIAPEEHEGPMIQFTNGRLNFAERNWITYDNDITQALFGVVTALNAEGFSACKVTADTKTDPSTMFQRVWIQCGEKSILIARETIANKTFSTVDEHLGAIRD